MKITSTTPLELQDITTVQYSCFSDHRGYFSESYRRSDLAQIPALASLTQSGILQTNESYSKKGTLRGLHFQWNPFMGKLVRTVHGHMIDLILDIRKNSPTWGKIIAHDMPHRLGDPAGEWIYVPPGFAHGNYFMEDSAIEYFCSSEYAPNSEACISPLDSQLDWSLCKASLAKVLRERFSGPLLMSDKDKNGLSWAAWSKDLRANQFIYGKT